MNRIKKRLTVRLFSIHADDHFFNDFISIHHANRVIENNARIISIREKKHLIKIYEQQKYQEKVVYFVSVVRERNTWQAKALGDGTISGIPLNQGIIGDPYYFVIVPNDKVIAGFTTGVSGSLKTVANSALQQFNKDRLAKVSLEFISRNKELSKLRELSGFNKLHLKVNLSAAGELNDDTPEILRQLSLTPFMANNSEISLTLTEIGEGSFSEKNLMNLVDFLSENEGCSALTVQGFDVEGQKVYLDFTNTYAIFNTEIETRNKFVDEVKAKEILFMALDSFFSSSLINY